jgi:hypothetical protein
MTGKGRGLGNRRLGWRLWQPRQTRDPIAFSEIAVDHQLLVRDTGANRIMIDVCAQFVESFRPIRLFNSIERYDGRHHWRKGSRFPPTLIDQAAWGNLVALRSESDALRFAALAQRFSTT